MKKLLFSAVSLDIGGIETALVTLLNHLAKQKENEKYKYEITLVLEHKQGLFLDDIDRNIKILEYAPSKNKVVIFRKMLNLFKQIRFKLKYGNKFDFSASYATYSNPGAFVARIASKNSALWCHMDYMEMFENNETKVRNFFEEKRYKDFKHIIFVSDEGRKSFIKIFPEEKEKTLCIYNLIDYEKIVKMSEKSVNDFTTKENVITFINIGRHDEKQKRLTRIIDAVEHLKGNTKQNFRVIFIGDGPDMEKYQKIIEDKTFIVRKTAHFTEYFILGLILILYLQTKEKLTTKYIILAIIFCVLYATSDEIHQLFVDGRSCKIMDILIDTCGSSLAILGFTSIYKITTNLKKQKELFIEQI